MIDFWLQALQAPLGIVIETDDRILLRQQLYRARAEAKNEELEEIVIIFPLKEGELWLVKRDADEERG